MTTREQDDAIEALSNAFNGRFIKAEPAGGGTLAVSLSTDGIQRTLYITDDGRLTSGADLDALEAAALNTTERVHHRAGHGIEE